MLSSTFNDLKEHRKAATDAIERLGYRANIMERVGARADLEVIESSLQMVRDAKAYICIIGMRYGKPHICPVRNPDGLSLTELEFNEAMRLERPILLYIMSRKHLLTVDDIEGCDLSMGGRRSRLHRQTARQARSHHAQEPAREKDQIVFATASTAAIDLAAASSAPQTARAFSSARCAVNPDLDNAIADPRTYGDEQRIHAILKDLRENDPVHWTAA